MAPKKVLVSFDEGLLRRVDRTARERGLTRSSYLAELADRDTRRSGPLATPEALAAFARLDRLFADNPVAADAPDATGVIRQMRDSR